MQYSIVVPLYNEEGNIKELHKQINAVMKGLKKKYEIIFVDDRSTDNTLEIGRTLKPVILLELRRNSGQTAAMDAGIKHATGKYIITLDGDLQNDPKDIPGLIEYLERNNLDVVSGWRKKRKDPFLKRFISRGAHFLRSTLINDGIHDSGCSLKIYKRECFDTIDLYGEMHRFIPAILKIKGYAIGEKVVSHHPRIHGVTKYNWKRTVKGFLDMLSVWFWQKYITRPMHLVGGVGFLFFLFGFLASVYSFYLKIFQGVDLSDTEWSTLALFFFFFGGNYLLFGILFDLTSKNYYAGSKDKAYLVREVIENK